MAILLIRKIKNKSSGFTLIELLVVIAIIGVLSAVVISSLSAARVKARDARRLSDMKEIETALALYYSDYGYFPQRNQAHTENDAGGCGGSSIWCGATNSLKSDLAPYYTLPTKYSDGFDKTYYYRASAGDNYQSYGFMLSLESGNNSIKETSDGGSYGALYEVGFMPSYCKTKYNDNWWFGGANLCPGGN